MNTLKNVVEMVVANKSKIVRNTLVVAGTAIGLTLTAGLLNKESEIEEETKTPTPKKETGKPIKAPAPKATEAT